MKPLSFLFLLLQIAIIVYNAANTEVTIMEIAVLVEPSSTGYRASTQSPVPLIAEGATESAAMIALNAALRKRLQNGGKIRTLTLTDTETTEEICARMRADPLHAEMEIAFEEYRKVANAVEDSD